MKKVFVLAMVLMHLIALPIFSQSDLERQSIYKDYISNQDISNFFSRLNAGDTLVLKSSYNTVEYVVPDTVWKKRVKKPKENKHYILQYKWKGIPTAEKSKNGFFVYKQGTYEVDGKYKYLGYENSDRLNAWVVVYDPSTSRDIKVSLRNIKIQSPKVSREILTKLNSDTIFYTTNYGRSESDYHILKVSSVDYGVRVINSGYEGEMKIQAEGKDVKFKNGKLDIWNGKIISAKQYHEFMDVVEKDKQFLSLVVIDGSTTLGMEHYFHKDTMALYGITNEGAIYHCYAYGQSYKFGGDYYTHASDVRMLTPQDTTYLFNRGKEGEKYRLERAKQWDEKNRWLVDRDEQWDRDSCIVATLRWDCRLIDEYGDYKTDYSVKVPQSGTRLPVVCYGNDGDYINAYRVFYRGEFFVAEFSALVFDSEEQSAYLMRRGKQGYEERLKRAWNYDLVEAVAEDMERRNTYNKKQIFFTGCKVYDSGYGYDGLRLSFYNCFKKTIKYIDCTITPYNYFGEVQSDVIGRKSQSVRCIGPIEGVDILWGKDGTFEFDDVFCNRNGVIKDYKVTKIIITFTDNSTITYSGWNKVKPHSDL